MNTLDPHQMVRYFSDFLTEINLIISNIKLHTYQIVDVNIPCPKILQVYHSMASIISSTHKTYDDLKRIESVMTGVVKARRLLQKQQPLTPLQSRFRCRSEDTNQHQNEKASKCDSKRDVGIEAVNQNRTIKRNNISNELKLQIPTDIGKEITDRKVNDPGIAKEQDRKTVKYVTDRGSQSSSDRTRPLMTMKKWLEERIEKIVASNRTGVSKIMSSNSECLRLVRSAKKEFISKN